MIFNQSRLAEYCLYPYAVILQVTPIVAIAPLLLVYLPQEAAVLTCAWLVAFFPVLALPFILGGLRIAGGLALVTDRALRRWHESAVTSER